jgi:hypothetical protein
MQRIQQIGGRSAKPVQPGLVGSLRLLTLLASQPVLLH